MRLTFISKAKSTLAAPAVPEIGAAAWGMFAFWRLHYDWRTEHSPHTLHETLDTARSLIENMRTAAPDLTDTEQRKVLGSFLFSGDDVDKPVGVLSGGEKTRLALALLVVSGANVLLLDEPTNNLDPASREEILAALAGFRGAIVLVTHDEGAVDALSPQRVIVLPEGTEDTWSADFADLVALA